MWRAGRGLSLRLIEGGSRPLCCPQTKPSSSSSSSQRPQTEKQKRRRLKDEAILSAKDSVKPAEDSVVRWREKQKIEYTGATSPGAKKDCSLPFPLAYCPDYVESSWYQWWEKEGFFTPEQHERLPQAVDRTFSLCIPPPNVTGTLHLGHALTVAVEDALVRWRRMQGHRVLWVPGCDHAGIATQTVVERKLLKERGLSRKDFSREEFLQEIWRWKNEKGEEIYEQLRKLGASLDWSRACFTLDPGFSRAVTEAFVRLYDSGLIYRSEALVNWSCALQSAISDIEVDSLELRGQTLLPVPGYDRKVEFGTMVTFAYPLDGHDGEVCVSTTRPETILGDVAVAVHPEDPRYQAVHGKLLRHPFSDRLLPVITDHSVNMTLGTGAAKVTPAHDQADFLLSQRHALPRLTVMAGDGTMTPPCGGWLQGVKRFDARQQVIEALTEKKLFRGKKSHAMTLPVCSRSGDIIEPLLKQQWFLRCESMAGRAVQAVEDRELEIVPQLYAKTWKNWLSNISDWCVSRQLWWGHQIPAYKVQLPDSAEAQQEELWVCARSEDEARQRAAVKHGVKQEDITLTRDPDVLDTWFSSALFPFAMLGWPDQTPDLQRFYPNSMLETGSDLIFFWVARMVMLGTELTGQLPFKQVLLHAMVRDRHSRKMSKSLGNVIDPLDIIHGVSLERLEEKVYEGNLDPREQQVAIEAQRRDYPGGIPQCGTDALRFSLCFQKIQGDTISLSLSHVLSCRHFCNKMWQTLRFTLGVLESNNMTKIGALEETTPLSSMDRWICSRLYSTVLQVEAAFESYELQTVTSTLHTFWLTSLCDVYLECVKPLLTQQEGRGHSRDEAAARSAASVLYHCVSTSLTLLSPFMPFITEELWQRLQPFGGGASGQRSISLQPYPRSEHLAHWFFPDEERDFSLALEVIREARSLKVQTELTRTRPDMWVVCSPAQALLLLRFESAVKTLCQVSSLHVYCPDVTDGPPSLSSTPPPAGTLVGVVDHTCQIHLHVQCGVNLDKQLKRLSERRQKLLLKLGDVMNRIQPEAKVPAHARQHIDTKVSSLQTQLKTLEDQISALQGSQKS